MRTREAAEPGTACRSLPVESLLTTAFRHHDQVSHAYRRRRTALARLAQDVTLTVTLLAPAPLLHAHLSAHRTLPTTLQQIILVQVAVAATTAATLATVWLAQHLHARLHVRRHLATRGLHDIPASDLRQEGGLRNIRARQPAAQVAAHLAHLTRHHDPDLIALAGRQQYWDQDAASLLTLLERFDARHRAALCRLASSSLDHPQDSASTPCTTSCRWPAGCRASRLLRHAAGTALSAEAADVARTLLATWDGSDPELTTLASTALS